MADIRILTAVNKKDSILYKYVYNSHYASLCHYAKRFLGDFCDEEDLVQEIFVKLWERENSFENNEAIIAYLYRAVHNACLSYIRDHKTLTKIDLLWHESICNYDSKDNEQMLVEEEYFRQIYVAISKMPDQRRLIILWSMEGKTNNEIAAELNISVNTVKTLKKKAYEYLRKTLSYPTFCFFLLLL